MREHYNLARCICARAAQERQKIFKFGERGSKTVDIEIDEHSWASRQVGDQSFYYV